MIIREAKNLTKSEKEKVKEFKKRFSSAKVYCLKDDILSPYHKIIVSVLNLKIENNRHLMNCDNSQIITDTNP